MTVDQPRVAATHAVMASHPTAAASGPNASLLCTYMYAECESHASGNYSRRRLQNTHRSTYFVAAERCPLATKYRHQNETKRSKNISQNCPPPPGIDHSSCGKADRMVAGNGYVELGARVTTGRRQESFYALLCVLERRHILRAPRRSQHGNGAKTSSAEVRTEAL